jgi:hypothetical protein
MARLHALVPVICQIGLLFTLEGCGTENARTRPRNTPDDDTGGAGGATSTGGKKGGGGGTGGGGGSNAVTKDAGGGFEAPPADSGSTAPPDVRPGDALVAADVMVQPAAPKLSKDVLPILKMKCALAGCHDPIKKEHGMDMSSAATIFPAWVNKITADHCKNNAAVTRVVPFKPDESFVVTLISAVPGRCSEVPRMPPRALPQLPAAEVKVIRDWVLAGALND